MRQFWVIGGTYKDTQFSELADGTVEVRKGPFDTYDAANKAWQGLAWATVDDALAQYHIEQEELEESDQGPTYWVMGGIYADGSFESFVGAPERYGPYTDYEAAKEKWAELAWASVDDATARYRIETLHPRGQAAAKEKLAYRLLTGADDTAFCERVSAALADGYDLYGSPSISQGEAGVKVAQALILKK